MRHKLSPGSQLTHQCGEPRRCYTRWRQQLDSTEALLLVDFEFRAHWLESPHAQTLTAIYYVCAGEVQVAVSGQALVAAEAVAPGQQFRRWLSEHGLVSATPASPLLLAPRTVAKPWGREIWYTGVERRAVCDFAQAGARSPIPWLQAALPGDAAGAPGEPLVLLKVLDPSPQPVLGELYFELHERKRELYVVTHIDRRAWPDGVGYMRYGFDPAVIAGYATEDQFRAAYLAAVQAYEVQRRELDQLSERGESPNAGQLEREQLLRQTMNRFSHLLPLQTGSVIQVPLRLPHALLHGVRVVEFQTPVYERRILSFGQKVLTQAHWDTAESLAAMQLVAPPVQVPEPAHISHGVTLEKLGACPDFEVSRVTLQPGCRWQIAAEPVYRLVMVVSGLLDLAGAAYSPDQAVLLPCFWQGCVVAPEAAPPLVFLLARPRP